MLSGWPEESSEGEFEIGSDGVESQRGDGGIYCQMNQGADMQPYGVADIEVDLGD